MDHYAAKWKLLDGKYESARLRRHVCQLADRISLRRKLRGRFIPGEIPAALTPNFSLFREKRIDGTGFRCHTVILADYLNSVSCCSVQRPFFNFQIEFSRGDIQSAPDNVINRLGGDSTCGNKWRTWNKILLCRASFQRESTSKIYRVYLNLANYRLGMSK